MTGRIFGTQLMAALTALFNALALNLVMIVASLPLITAPTAVSATSAALDRWARDGEDRVVRQFITEFRARLSAPVMLGVGAPLGAVVLGGVEVRHFAREATLTGRAGLCIACGALFITLAALGYVFQLSADDPGMRPVDLWSLATRLALRNLPVAGHAVRRPGRGPDAPRRPRPRRAPPRPAALPAARTEAARAPRAAPRHLLDDPRHGRRSGRERRRG